MTFRSGPVPYLAAAAALLLILVVRIHPFAAVVACSFGVCAAAGCLVSLGFMRNKLSGFALALALTGIFSFAAYLGATMAIKGATITADELNWLLVLFLGCLFYAAVATPIAYPLLATLLHRFLSHRFHHLRIPPRRP